MFQRASYRMCPKCKFIDAYPHKIRENKDGIPQIDHNLKCKECGHYDDESQFEKSNSFYLWPRFDVVELMQDNIFDFLKENTEEYDHDYIDKFKLFFYNSATDFLIDDLLWSILEKHDTKEIIAKYILEEMRNFPQKEKFFKKVVGKSFCEAFKLLGYEDYYVAVRNLRERRNDLTHKTFDVDCDGLRQDFSVIEQKMMGAFKDLHNKYARV